MRRMLYLIIAAFLFVGSAWAQETPDKVSAELPIKRTAAAVDREGRPLTDPSENVKAVLEAGLKALADLMGKGERRHDDLRTADEKLLRAELRRVDDIETLTGRYDIVIRDFMMRMAETESKRIDANRAADAAAAKEASTLALSSIKDITAQAFTAQSAATAKSDAAADKRYEQLKSEMSGSLKSLDEKVVLLTSQNNQAAGKDAASGAFWGIVGVVIGLMIAGATLVVAFARKSQSPITPPWAEAQHWASPPPWLANPPSWWNAPPSK